MTALLLRDVELVPGRRADVRISRGRVTEIGPHLARTGAAVLAGHGGALLPGLTDHHLHLLATAADGPLRCGPPEVTSGPALAAALAAAPTDEHGWVRGTGYDERVAGALDRRALDLLHPTRPVRLQHRSGGLWVLNSAALKALGLAGHVEVAGLDPGVERDSAGYCTGRLWRADRWLRARLPAGAPPDLARLGRRLAALGITSVTDAGPDLTSAEVSLLSAAVRRGDLPQRVTVLGASPGDAEQAGMLAGPWKIVVSDHALPPLDGLTEQIARAHASGRPVAVHVVSRVALVLTLAALFEAGCLPGDRLEHVSVAPAALLAELRRAGVRAVVQPGFLAARGDAYLDEVDAADLPDLHRYATLLRAGIAATPSSDAPYGPLDPWRCIRAAGDRRVPDGRLLGRREAVPAATALAGYLSPSWDPGGPPQRIRVGMPADLVLLHVGWPDLLDEPSADLVRRTMIGGRVVWAGEVERDRAG